MQAIARALNICPSHVIANEEIPESKTSSQIRHDLSLEEISRALEFVEHVDEMVWRRTSFPLDPSPGLLFSGSNIEALRARLEFWERVVRRTGM